MKKLIVLLLAATLIGALCSCTNSFIPVAFTEDDVTEYDTVEKEYSFGEINGNVYESEFIGIGVELDESWTFSSREEILEMNGFVLDQIDEDLAEELENASIIHDMVANSPMRNININLEKASSSNADVDAMYDATLPYLEELYESMGAENIDYRITEIEFGGKTQKAIVGSVTVYGIGMSQASVVVPCNGYYASISITAANESEVEELIGRFYWL